MTPVIVIVLMLIIIVSIVVLSTKNKSITTNMPTSAWSKDLRKGIRKNPTTGTSTYNWKLKETWEDYPMPDYNAVHTYCQVVLMIAVNLSITELEILN